MKKLSIVVSVFLIFAPLSALAIQYCIDFLEYNNPGGWEYGLKTCDQFIGGTSGYDTYLIDVWINDVPEPLVTAGFWLTYDCSGYSDLFEVRVYDGLNGPPGPWHHGLTTIIHEPDPYLYDEAYYIYTGNLNYAQPDASGDIIIAQLELLCWPYCWGLFSISTVPGFDTVIGESSTTYDPTIPPVSLPLSCSSIDYDDDGLEDWMDNCYRIPNGPDRGSCTSGSIENSCMLHAECGTKGFCSLNQEDTDSDYLGDACDDDDDNDLVPDNSDNCPLIQNGPTRGTCYAWSGMSSACTSDSDCGGLQSSCSTDQEDPDSDAVGEICDNCPNEFNPNQDDLDEDLIGDICDPDDDGDGLCDPGESSTSCSGSDECPRDPENDSDNDTICGDLDNCSTTPNPTQQDSYPPQGNSIGDACDCEGNFDCDADTDGTDAATFKLDFGRNSFLRPCISTDTCNGDFSCDGDVDGTDAALFKQDFGRSQFSNPCSTCTQGIPWCVYP